MKDQLPVMAIPQWLQDISASPQRARPFPLRDILHQSLYYPASGIEDGNPVKFLCGKVFSFVFADYGISKTEFMENINGHGKDKGFVGYSPILQREIYKHEVVPDNWRPYMIPEEEYSLRRLSERERKSTPFGHWSVWKKKPSRNGPELFSFFYLNGEMSAIYEGLYARLAIAPLIVAVINPGCIGGEWESVKSNDSFFLSVLKSNRAGLPKYLLFKGNTNSERPCWDIYGSKIAQLPEQDLGIYELKSMQHKHIDSMSLQDKYLFEFAQI